MVKKLSGHGEGQGPWMVSQRTEPASLGKRNSQKVCLVSTEFN